MTSKLIMHYKRCFILTFTLLSSSNAIAQDEDEWQFILTPVLWNASVDASFSDGGGGDLPIDPDYSFFSLENLDDYLSLKFEANHGRFGFLFDSLRARYQDEAANKIASFGIGTELGFIESSIRYQLYDDLDLDVIAGLRYTFLDIDKTLSLPMNTNTTRYSFSWTDPLIGLRYHYPLAKKWHTWLRADIGGFGVSTQRIINITGDVQYIINTHVSFSMGYRYLEIDFKEGDILYDVTLNGLQISVGIHF